GGCARRDGPLVGRSSPESSMRWSGGGPSSSKGADRTVRPFPVCKDWPDEHRTARLQEMQERVKGYDAVMDRVSVGCIVYLKQWLRWRNLADRIELTFNDYPIPTD